MRRQTLFGVGAALLGVLGACNSYDTSPGSNVGQTKGGSGGSGGEAGSLSLGFGAGGSGGGGTGGTSGSGGVATSGGTQAGSSSGGVVNHAGTSAGGGGNGGSAPAGTCKRVPANDADCTDFEETPSQAYACDDTGAYLTLNGMHASKCANVQGVVAGAKVGACCPP
jgi:hypothetical protein